MKKNNFISLFLLLAGLTIYAQSPPKKYILIKGSVLDKETKQSVQDAGVQVLNSTFATTSAKKGAFELLLPKVKHLTLKCSHLNYKNELREIDLPDETDTIRLTIYLKSKVEELELLTVTANPRPDTVFGNNTFSIQDFDFYEDKYLLLSFDKKTDQPFVRLVDEGQHILSSFLIPQEAANVKELYRDFMGYVNIICKESIYRIVVRDDVVSLVSLPVEDYNALVKPVIDTLNSQLLFSNYNSDFPMFSYFAYNPADSSKKEIATIENEDLMQAYRFEYYSLKPRDKLTARNIADEYGIDKHKAAAMISGFTHSMYYTPLYAPLFVMGDTIHVFDHYKDCLFHFNKKGQKLDSVKINYHHPKNWREWKNCMLKDLTDDAIYAVYNSNGHKYMKGISYKTGKEQGTYKIIHYSAEKIKVRDGYIYYVYRPFESLQEKFLYKERLLLSAKTK